MSGRTPQGVVGGAVSPTPSREDSHPHSVQAVGGTVPRHQRDTSLGHRAWSSRVLSALGEGKLALLAWMLCPPGLPASARAGDSDSSRGGPGGGLRLSDKAVPAAPGRGPMRFTFPSRTTPLHPA